MVTPVGYTTPFMGLIQRKGRSGWYLQVAVPREHRQRLGRDHFIRKAGNTHSEAAANRSRLMQEIEAEFLNLKGTGSLVKRYESSYRVNSLVELNQDDKDILLADALSVDKASVKELNTLKLALAGAMTWQEWIDKRCAEESIAASTRTRHQSTLSQLAHWMGTEYLQDLTELQAIEYKAHLLKRCSQASVKSYLSLLKAYWAWAVINKQVETNVWLGLTKKLKDSKKKSIAKDDVVSEATSKAIRTRDYRYLIMRYMGCRSGDVNGLRHCDIDLTKGTIRFEEWEAYGKERRLKGGTNEERTVPMSSTLQAALGDMELNNSDLPIWPNAYKLSTKTWGDGWSGSFKDKYGFNCHDLRRRTETIFALKNVSPYIAYEITRHTVPGMSQVTKLYVRPTTEELMDAVEALT